MGLEEIQEAFSDAQVILLLQEEVEPNGMILLLRLDQVGI